VGSELRFHLDECVGSAIAAGLRRRGIDVTTTPELGLQKAEDLSQLEIARKAGRVLVTQDTDFLRIHGQGIPHCGVVYYNVGTAVGVVIKGLVLIHGVLSAEEMEGNLEFL
jgi:predicted nuclease of predicted toxin-antitoxin system